ncbi:MAG: hypothetical protein AB1512_01990 [Thermodesulfobacteriota bacterium]
MEPQAQPSGVFPFRLEGPSGLSVQVNSNGSIRRMDCGDILLNLFLGTEMEGGPANLYLRRHDPAIEVIPLLGPRGPSAFQFDRQGMTAAGEWRGIHFHLRLVLAESAPAWFWHVSLKNSGSAAETIDLLYAQDLALAHYWAVRLNEYYTGHYVDHTALHHPKRGTVLCSRQNLSMGGRNPWSLIGALGRATGYATDALQVHGLAARAGRLPAGVVGGLPGARLQHEHSMAAIQDTPVRLEPGEATERGFIGWFEADHPAATSEADLVFIDKALSLPEAVPPREQVATAAAKPPASLFSTAPLLEALELSEPEIGDLFGEDLREMEREDGRLLSFFVGRNRHVVLKAKELRVLRPHAHILRTGHGLIPDEAAMTSTVWMGGVFHSMVTQGHVSINRFLSTVHSYLSLFRANGQRLFADLDGAWHLLDVPSAFEMSPQECRWVYRHQGGTIIVRSEARTGCHELTLSIEVLSGPPVRFLLSSHLAINGDDGSEAVPGHFSREGEGVRVRPVPGSDVGQRFPEGSFLIESLPGATLERVGGDELLFPDGRSRNQPFLCMVTGPTRSAGFRLTGRLLAEPPVVTQGPDEDRFWADMSGRIRFLQGTGGPGARVAARFGEIVPWFVHNALIHYLAPRGIEQYTGGGWGTRDISQGPVEMLLALGRFDPVRDLLIRVFRTQNADGDWPQWFMFFDRERNIRPSDSHGDIVFWPLLALAQYLAASGDETVLDEMVPFFHPEGDQKAERTGLWGHVERALAVIAGRIVPGTRLAAYGHGDWNDSMQPFDPAMRERLCSSWTVTLHYQALTALATAFRRLGRSVRAAEFEALASAVREEFQLRLIVDETVTGLAYFHEDGRIDYLLHPSDRSTGVCYSLLPMIHAIINDLFTPDQAARHLALIRAHLLGPDGARLFDRPMEYRGGTQRYFQRAETAAFFGREIGLMYTHAHLRYAEALAHYGDADGFFLALSQANPIAIREVVPAATLRQANCYYSSSDAAFADRYQASAEYGRVMKGEVPLDGGWRVYSSGAGICTRLVIQCFLGVQRQKAALILDPVIPKTLDGLQVEMEWDGRMVEITYRVQEPGCGPTAVSLNGVELPLTRCANPYRMGAVEIQMEEVRERLREGTNRLIVQIG